MGMEKLERLIVFFGFLCFAVGPIWYWGFADRSRHYDYAAAKRIMEDKVIHDHRVTIYCEAQFDKDKNAWPPPDFEGRGVGTMRVNWEHAVPVATLGAGVEEWHTPPSDCRNSKRKLSRRECVEATNDQFRTMIGDMYNLFPALAPINSARRDREYADLPYAKNRFGSCGVKWVRGKFEPPDRAKGQLARATLYMDKEYKAFVLTQHQRQLMMDWNLAFPVNKWECVRAKRIEKLQGNENHFVKEPCKKAGLW